MADHQRVSRRAAPVYHSDAAALTHSRQQSVDDGGEQTSTNHVNGDSRSYEESISREGATGYNSRGTISPPQTSPPSHPPPPVPEVSPPSLVPPAAAPVVRTPSPAARPHRESQPLPMLPAGGSYQAHGRSQTPPPPLPQQGNRILFYGMWSRPNTVSRF